MFLARTFRGLVSWLVFSATAAVASAGSVPADKPSDYPAWWFERDVIVRLPGAPTRPGGPSWALGDYPGSDDFAVANAGQLKNLAKGAYESMKAKGLIGPSTDPGHPLVSMWDSVAAGTDNFAVINLGQLKFVGSHFHEKLFDVGQVHTLPEWLLLPGSDDFAIANQGQLKSVFSFDLQNAAALSASALGVPPVDGVDMASCVAWFRADQGVVRSGELVTTWQSQVGGVSLVPYPAGGASAPRWVEAENQIRAVRIQSGVSGTYLKTGASPFGTKLNTRFTILCVVRPSPATAASESPRFEIAGGDNGFRLWSDSSDGNELVASLGSGRLLNHGSDGTVSADRWQHFALTFDAGRACLYKGGRLVAEHAFPSGALSWPDLRVGRDSSAFFAELMLFDRVLSPAQVLAHAESADLRYRAVLRPGLGSVVAPLQAPPAYSASGASLDGQPVTVTVTRPVNGQTF